MRNRRSFQLLAAAVFSVVLSACGGGGVQFGDGRGGTGSTTGGTTGSTTGSTTGATTGGTTATGIEATLDVATGATGLVADGVSSAAFTATLKDTAGQAISGKTLTFSTSSGKVSPTSPVSYGATADVVTDSSGKAVVFLQSGTQIGSATVTARDSATGLSGANTIPLVAGPATKAALAIAPGTVAPGGTASILVAVTDAKGNPVEHQSVNLTTNNTSGAHFNSSLLTTDSGGNAATSYTAAAVGSSDDITATISGFSTTKTLVVSSTAASIANVGITLGGPSATANGTSKTTVVALVTGNNGAGLAGVTVNFSTTSGSLASPTATTGADGRASVSLTSPVTAGTATVTVETGGFTASQDLAFVPGAIAKINLSPSPSTVSISGGTQNSKSTITVVALDANNNPVPRQTVTVSFTGTAHGTLAPLNVVTDGSGTGTTIYQAGNSTGSTNTATDTITATSSSAPATVNPAVITITTPAGAAQVGSVSLLLSSPTLATGSTSTSGAITATAIVRDTNNNVMSAQMVTFSSSSTSATCGNGGAIQVLDSGFGSGVTDAAGQAQALISAGGDTSAQTLTLVASVGGKSATTTVPVLGTQAVISASTGQTSVTIGDTVSFMVKVVNASGTTIPNQSVTLTSTNSNSLNGAAGGTPVTVNTGAGTDGVAFTYAGNNAGTDTVQGTPAGCANAGAATFSVSGAKFVFTNPAANATQVKLGVSQALEVQHTDSTPGFVATGEIIDISATRGTLTHGTCFVLGANGKPASDCTGDTTKLPAIVQNAGPGGAGTGLVTAQIRSGGPTATRTINFVSTTPASINVQASPANVQINGRSQLVATVRDADNNLVTGATVTFSLQDITGGVLSASTAVTDTNGQARDSSGALVTYTASNTASARNGVKITATVFDPSTSAAVDTKSVNLSVGGQGLRIALAEAHDLLAPTPTTYQLQYNVSVLDSNGNPPPAGTSVVLSAVSAAYQKGVYVQAGTVWSVSYAVKQVISGGVTTENRTVMSTLSPVPNIFGCRAEDANLDGSLEAGEDDNFDGVLEPSNVASVPTSVTLDASGFAQFTVTYGRSWGSWIQIRLTATATVQGTEASATVDRVLPISVPDDTITNGDPPGGTTSPFGDGTTSAAGGNSATCSTPD